MPQMKIMRCSPVIICLLLVSAMLGGCIGKPETPSWSVDSNGRLSETCPLTTVSEEILVKNDTFTESRITLHSDQGGDIVLYSAVPEKPVAAVVYVPGAGETAAAHSERMIRYAKAGYAFLYADIRGNNGETPGLPFGQQLIQSDYTKFENKEWPQYYLTLCDLSSARRSIADKYDVPVYIMGSSNGGRYAAIAAAVDPAFAGYVGISTSDWGIRDAFAEQGYTGDPLRFAVSLEPSSYIGSISPRPVWMFHAAADPIIPYDDGLQLYASAKDPKTFIPFNGSHGINSEVDSRILSAWAQIYGTRG